MIPFVITLLRALFIGSSILAPLTFSIATAQTKAGCNGSCGNLMNIPFPFGIRSEDESCHLTGQSNVFVIDCSETDQQGNPIPYWSNPSSEVIIKDISLENHEVTIMMFVARDCYNDSGWTSTTTPSLTLAVFPISSAKNKFTAVGCDTNAVLNGLQGSSFATGCMSLCNSIDDVTNGSCSGIGCCQTTIPRNVMWYSITLSSYSNHSKIIDFNPCSFSFVAEKDYFNFSTQSLLNMTEERVPLVLEWSVGHQTCQDAQKNTTSYMCMENSNCTDSTNWGGYRCHCKEGYQGNPYLSNQGRSYSIARGQLPP